jgi:hypothetical protein
VERGSRLAEFGAAVKADDLDMSAYMIFYHLYPVLESWEDAVFSTCEFDLLVVRLDVDDIEAVLVAKVGGILMEDCVDTNEI